MIEIVEGDETVMEEQNIGKVDEEGGMKKNRRVGDITMIEIVEGDETVMEEQNIGKVDE